jgi:hypothetical protein
LTHTPTAHKLATTMMKAIVREVAAVYAIVAFLTFAVLRFRGTPVDAGVHLTVAAVFLFGAISMARREPDGFRRMGISLGGVLEPADPNDRSPFALLDLARTLRSGLPIARRETGVAMLLALLIFPPFAVAFALWHDPSHPFSLRVADDFATFAAAQFLVVALPEEAFFRGYLQTRLTDLWPAKHRLLGVEVSLPALVMQAALFAIVHLFVDFNLLKLAVFFPALLFGWIRYWRGGIGAALAFHALCNIYSELLTSGWL